MAVKGSAGDVVYLTALYSVAIVVHHLSIVIQTSCNYTKYPVSADQKLHLIDAKLRL